MKGTVAVVLLMGNMQTRRDRCGATGGWVMYERERGWRGVTDGRHVNKRGQWCYGWVMCNERGHWLWCHGWAMCEREGMAVSWMGDQRMRGDSGCGVTEGECTNESGQRVWCHVDKRGWVDVKALVRTWGCSEGWCRCK